MQPVLDFLKLSIEDQFFSKSERKSLREIIDEVKPNEQQLAFYAARFLNWPIKKPHPKTIGLL